MKDAKLMGILSPYSFLASSMFFLIRGSDSQWHATECGFGKNVH
jgi:hypothetical protein